MMRAIVLSAVALTVQVVANLISPGVTWLGRDRTAEEMKGQPLARYRLEITVWLRWLALRMVEAAGYRDAIDP